MLEEGLLNHAAVGFSESGRKASELRNLLAKIEESEVHFLSLPSFLWNSCVRPLTLLVLVLTFQFREVLFMHAVLLSPTCNGNFLNYCDSKLV